MNKKINYTNPKIIAAFALIACFFWGAATPTIKIAYKLYQIPSSDTASIIRLAGTRFLIAGILTFAAGSIIEKQVLFPKKSSWGIISIQAMVQTVLQYILFFIGVANCVGAKGAIISGTNSFFCVLIAGLIFKMEKISPKKVLGCVIGFIGILILNINNNFQFSFSLTGEGFIVFSTICYAISTVTIKRFSVRDNPITICAWQFIIGGIIMILIGALLGGKLNPATDYSWVAIAALSIYSAAAFWLWSMLLMYNPVSKVSIYSLSIPIFGVVMSMILLSEKINAVQYMMALVLVCIGIFMINTENSST